MYRTIRAAKAKSPTIIKAIHADSKGPKPRGFKGEPGDTIEQRGAILLGLGMKKGLTRATLRKAGAGLVRSLDKMEIKAITLDLKVSPTNDIESATDIGRCIAEGMGLANWRVDFFDGDATKTPKPLTGLSIHANDADLRKGLKHGLSLANSTNYARRVAATPPNICNPTWMATEARRLARSQPGLTCKVITYADAKRLGMGGIVNVGKGSATKPCLIQLDYRPARTSRAAKAQHLVLVGKTITYDTGGYSLKISNGMKGMKYDKNGGMAVLGAMHAIASLKLPVKVTALLPTAENMVNGESYRPDDIITMFGGVTVEVTNTDAEGRLVLGDALAYACKKLKPTAIVDMATLTGGVVVALGSWSAGLWCDDDSLRDRIYTAANTSGEMVWRMPLWEPHREFMRSKHADIWNSGPKRDGHPIQGAAFLSYFVDEKIPWAHIDIAGVSTVDADTDQYVAGPTGFGVRLLTGLVESWG